MLLTSFDAHVVKYSDCSFDASTEWNQVRTKYCGLNIFEFNKEFVERSFIV